MAVIETLKPPIGFPAEPPPLSFEPRRPRRSRWTFSVAAVLLGAALLGGLAFVLIRPGRGVHYETIAVARRSLVQTVTATGVVNPQDTINIGTQVSGTISDLYVDYNSHVRAGQVLAKIDPVLLRAAADQARGAVVSADAQSQAADAGVRASQTTAQSAAANAVAAASSADAAAATAQANRAAIDAADSAVIKARSARELAEITSRRDRQLLGLGYISQSQSDNDSSALVAARTAYDSALAAARQVRAQAAAAGGAADASLAQSHAQRLAADTAAAQHESAVAVSQGSLGTIAQQRAALEQAQVNLDHTVITSPVDGTVIARNVSIGQTVAASFQTPTLFTIARNLRKMEVDVAVGEPDIGGVRAGQLTNFTVLAYPSRIFKGHVWIVRQNPTTVANVVTYDTVVYVDNFDGALRPGMTANASIQVAGVRNEIVVPLEALTYAVSSPRPRATTLATTNGSVWGQTLAAGGASITAGSRGRIHLLVNGKPQRIPVRIVLVAGTDAAIRPLNTPIPADARIIVADDANPTPHATVNPAAPFGQPQQRTGPR